MRTRTLGGAWLAALAVTAGAVASAEAKAAPKAGSACTKAQVGKSTAAAGGGTVTCKKSGKKYTYVKSAKSAAATTTKKATASPETTAAPKATTTTVVPLSGPVVIDGSSTVAPLTETVAEMFQHVHSKARVTVGISGTGGGFKKFCAGETDVQDASRPISASEKSACASAGIKYQEFLVANDALTVVVNQNNTWAKCLSTEQLKKIWDAGSTVKNWKDVSPLFPDEPLTLFGAGTNSGTFDFFTEVINGTAKRSRSDYLATEDDNVTVQGVSGTKGGLGYFGYTYFEENKGKLNAVQVNPGNGCVEPSADAVQSGVYTPLGRPLYIYAKKASMSKPQVKGFIEYYLANTGAAAKKSGYVGLTKPQNDALSGQLAKLLAAD